ncbi:MAG: START domain-containing protein [Saprospiraceae bacterium]
MTWVQQFSISVIFVGAIASNAISQSWQRVSTEDNMTLYTRQVKNTSIKEFKIEATISESMMTIVRCIKDVSALPNWYDKIKTVKTLKVIDDNAAIYIIEYALPFPFTNRVSTVLGKYTITDDKTSAHIESGYTPHDIPKSMQNLVPVTVIASSWDITAITPKECQVSHTGYMDPAGQIPDWAVNESILKGPYRTIRNFKKILQNYR